MKYEIASYGNGTYQWKLYVNTRKLTWQQIQKETGCDVIFNLGYYDMQKYVAAKTVQAIYDSASSGLVVNGTTIKEPRWHEYGVCIDQNGHAICSTEDSNTGKINYCVAQPPLMINGKKRDVQSYGKNGTTVVGFKADNTMVVLLCSKDVGMTSDQALNVMKSAGCVDVLRYDGSWSTQGCLGPGKTVQPSMKRIVHNYMIGFKEKLLDGNGGGTTMQIKTELANRKNYGGYRLPSAIKYIVIHYTGNDGDTDESNAKYYKNNVPQSSAHYFVDSDSITQSVPDNYAAWAVGGDKYDSCVRTGGGKYHGICKNANSISIEICDDKRNGVLYPSQATISRTVELTKFLMKKYGIPASNVIRHFDVTGKLCPAYWVDNAKWQSEFWTKIGGKVTAGADAVNATVKTVQSGLNQKYGAGLSVDGSWGPASKKAMIRAVQTELNRSYGKNLVVDGSWGPASKNACPGITQGAKGNIVWLLQACLTVHGVNVSLDSSFGPATKTAVQNFQRANGLTADGSAGPATWTKLLA